MERPAGDPRLPYRTLREFVQNALREDILRIRFLPGQRLLEGELAAMYGVSRAPVREAVRTLTEQGLLRSISNKGVLVSHLSANEIREVYEMRIELEPLAARLAAPLIVDARLQHLLGLLTEMDAALDDPAAWLPLNNEFHRVLYAAAGRVRLSGLIDELTDVVEPYIRLFLRVPGALQETHRDHHEILAAAARHDAPGCAAVVRRHLEDASARVVRLAGEERE